jgi:hypothetical protein
LGQKRHAKNLKIIELATIRGHLAAKHSRYSPNYTLDTLRI